MIWILNRHEVYCGFSMVDFNKTLGVLRTHKIRYTYRIVGYSSGNSVNNTNYSKMYYIYVNKKDAEKANGALKQAADFERRIRKNQ